MCADRLIEGTPPPAGVIETEAQATNYVVELVAAMEKTRAACDVPYHGNDPDTLEAYRRMMWTFLTKQGQVVGAANALRLAGLLSERAWTELHQKALNALAPTVVTSGH